MAKSFLVTSNVQKEGTCNSLVYFKAKALHEAQKRSDYILLHKRNRFLSVWVSSTIIQNMNGYLLTYST